MKKLFLLGVLCAALLLGACGPAAAQKEETKEVQIKLKGDSVSVSGGGARVDGTTVTIASGGEFRVTGSLDNGQLIVDTGDEAMDVYLTLDGASIANAAGAALYVKQAKNVYLSTAQDTKNMLVSGTEADMEKYDGTQDGAALFSEDDLKIDGEGELEIRGYINNGVTCKDDLDVTGGTLVVLAAGNGLRGSESVEIKGGEIRVTAGNDGIKSSSSAKAGKGFVTISGGTVAVIAQGDGVSAETVLTLSGGDVTVDAQGTGLEQSSKALKANTELVISGGMLELSAIEDAISCDGNVTISGGTQRVITAGDGVQAGEKGSGVGDITISGGELSISAERRALNARGSLTLNGGRILAYIGIAKQAEPEGSAAVLFTDFSGAAGDRLTLDGRELEPEPACAYVAFLYAGGDLTSGESYTLSNGLRTISVAAK